MCAKIAYGEAPSAPYIHYLVKQVKETGIVIYKSKRRKPITVRTPENIAAVAVNSNPPSFSTIKHFIDIIATNKDLGKKRPRTQ